MADIRYLTIDTTQSEDRPTMEIDAFTLDQHKLYLVDLLPICTNWSASPAYLTNSGAIGMTDWEGDNIGNEWKEHNLPNYAQFNITSGNGFVGRAQRMVVTTEGDEQSYLGIKTITAFMQTGSYYHIQLRYRSNRPLDIAAIKDDFSGITFFSFGQANVNEGSAATLVLGCRQNEVDDMWLSGSNLWIGFITPPTTGDWFEIDEVCCCDCNI